MDPKACDAYAAAGIGGISVWRQHIELSALKKRSHSQGLWLAVPALVRGFFTSHDAADRQGH